MRLIFLFFGLWIMLSCTSATQPKPRGYLRLEYPEVQYTVAQKFPYFTFEHNKFAHYNPVTESNINLIYPEMKATVYLNYNQVNKNLDSLLNDAYKLPYKHLSKAESIPERIFINPQNKVYGTLFSVVGDAASQYQFFLTDSSNNFLVGSLYFYAKPNYDSIFPAVKYLEKDLAHLMETLQWK